MSSNIVLGLATRQNLLSLQQINQQMDTAQNHLATGLKVSSAVDDAVKFFQSQSLQQRATDISTRKDQVDQGISALTAATNGVQSVVAVLQQMQGIINTAKTQTSTQRVGSEQQFNSLSTQLNNLVNDTSYQGLNLINSTTSTLSLQFSIASTSTMKIAGVDLHVSKLISGLSATGASAAASGLVTIGWSAVSAGSIGTSLFDAAFNKLQSAVFAAQSDAQTLGGNVTFLQTRLNFSAQYLTTLQGGSDKLIVADVNQESTDLVTLQTRQQLSIQSLSIATQSEQSVLRLFH